MWASNRRASIVYRECHSRARSSPVNVALERGPELRFQTSPEQFPARIPERSWRHPRLAFSTEEFAEHLAVVRGDGQVRVFIELLVRQARP